MSASKKSDTQLMETIDKNLGPSIRITIELVKNYVRENGIEVIPKSKMADARRDQKIARRIREMINTQTTREYGIATWQKECNDAAESVANGGDLPGVESWWSKEEHVQDGEELRYHVLKPAANKVAIRFIPTAVAGFNAIKAHCDSRLAELERSERKAHAAIGLQWRKSTEYMTVAAIRDLCVRGANLNNNVLALPSEMLIGLVDLD